MSDGRAGRGDQVLQARLLAWLQGRRSRSGAWLGYVTAIGCGAITAAIAKMWLPAALSASIGAAGVIIFGRIANQYLPEISRSANLRSSWPEQLANVSRGRLPSVSELSDPTALGVHPSGFPHKNGYTVDQPKYIERDIDRRLHGLLHGRQRFILILGESTAGKTRTAYEAIRECLSGHIFIEPISRDSISAALQAAQMHGQTVVWLDDLENYLGPNGLTITAVQRMIRDTGAVLIATMRTEEHAHYSAREGSRLTGADRDVWRAERSVVQMAAPVRLERRWSPEERQRARRYVRDSRIDRALRGSDRFGLAEILAAGPELLDSWRNAWVPGANPRGAAIVAMAVDCRRFGLRRTVPQQWLKDLHEIYLNEMGGENLRPEPFREALAWACQPIHATSSLLLGGATRGYVPFDYLIDTSRSEIIPEHIWIRILPELWSRILPRTTPLEAYDLGLVAHRDFRFDHAEEALRKAVLGGISGADFALAITLGDAGKHREAVQELEAVLDRRNNSENQDVHELLTIRHQIAYFIGEVGEQREAARLFAVLSDDASAALGPDHLDTLLARHQHAHFTGEAGDYDAALELLRTLAADRTRVLGAEHPHTLATRRSIAWFTGLNGDLTSARGQLDDLIKDASAVLGADDPHVFAIRGALAHFTGRAGDPEEAVRQLRSLQGDRARVMGAMHPHVLVTRQQAALFTAEAGDRSNAVDQLEAVVGDMRQVLDATHTHLRSAEDALTRIRNGGPVWVEGGGWA
jgi:hypothetical protein